MEKEQSFILETIKVMRPTSMNKIFNETDYDIITTSDENGEKLVILKVKQEEG